SAGHRWSVDSGAVDLCCPSCGAAAVGTVTPDGDILATVVTPPLTSVPVAATTHGGGDGPMATGTGGPFTPAFPPQRAADPPPDSEPIFRLPGYETVKQLGRGGMGIVYLMKDETLQRLVAVKLIRTGPWSTRDERQRFIREARLAAQIKHPGIVAVHAV